MYCVVQRVANEPALHDIARGTTGCGDDDDIDGTAYLDSYLEANDRFTIELPHVHDAGCNGTLEHGGEILCGYPGSTGHIYCG